MASRSLWRWIHKLSDTAEDTREYLADFADGYAHPDFRPHRDKTVGPSLELTGVGDGLTVISSLSRMTR
jgi:hypothetical protein